MPEKIYTTPLPQKLGIKPDIQLAILAAPDGFIELIGDPTHTTRITASTTLAICFIRSLADLSATLDILTARLPKAASVWIAHPKRSPKSKVNFNQNHVREAALAVNLVDYKVCSVDSAWSALKFAWRKP